MKQEQHEQENYSREHSIRTNRSVTSETHPTPPASRLGLANRWLQNRTTEEDDNKGNQENSSRNTSEAADIVDFMRTAWKLPTPNLIISVTGGAGLFENLPPHVYRLFQQGLVSAAVATSTNKAFVYLFLI